MREVGAFFGTLLRLLITGRHHIPDREPRSTDVIDNVVHTTARQPLDIIL